MLRIAVLLICLNLFPSHNAFATDKLVLDLDLDNDLLSLAHNVDNFLFPPTRNYAESQEHVSNDISIHELLKNHFVATALARIDGKDVGMVTEQELLYVDPDSGRKLANSMWLIRLNEPGLQGFITVNQIEDAHDIFSMAEKAMQSPDLSKRISYSLKAFSHWVAVYSLFVLVHFRSGGWILYWARRIY